jgi:hypothetical protein
MANPSKIRGTKWETALVRALGTFFDLRYGLAPRRVAQEGFADSGDLHGISPFIGQAKDWKSWEAAIREGLDGAQKQKANAGEPYGVAFVKRVRKPVGGGYAVMTIDDFARVLVRLRRAEAALARLSPETALEHARETVGEAMSPTLRE